MGWDEGKIESLLDYCTHDFNGAHQCGLHGPNGGPRPGPNFNCQWEGHNDPDHFRGIWDAIPPYK